MYSNHTETRMKKEQRNMIIGALVFSAFVGFVWYGFGEDQGIVQECEVIVQKYVTAEYSEYSCGLDMEGNTSCDTDYWSEEASDTFKVVTLNNQIAYSNVEDEWISQSTYGFYEPPMPPHDVSMKKDFDFDNFQNHRDVTMRVYVERKGEKDYFTESESYHNTCNTMREKQGFITIKTWYGISYGA